MSVQNVIREREALLVQELLDKCLVRETADRRADYEKASKWFEEKHHCGWQKCLPAEKIIVR